MCRYFDKQNHTWMRSSHFFENLRRSFKSPQLLIENVSKVATTQWKFLLCFKFTNQLLESDLKSNSLFSFDSAGPYQPRLRNLSKTGYKWVILSIHLHLVLLYRLLGATCNLMGFIVDIHLDIEGIRKRWEMVNASPKSR